ncbi:hypothetical protein EIP91_005970 [Steccherinum ochraceum]|uniref:Uncharacterized protein n=1 Tax=Steccherinum ochraceum TaxID=92696 RepID=A0A4R0R6R9_9APHY|nr:hypothetical protein EIP91_005970 [Steccherinum ochraceum]
MRKLISILLAAFTASLYRTKLVKIPIQDDGPAFGVFANDAKDPLARQLINSLLRIRNYSTFVDELLLQLENALSNILHAPRVILRPTLRADIASVLIVCERIRSKYRDLIWRSRELAGTAQAINFVQICIPRIRDDAVELDEMLLELSDYEKASSSCLTDLFDKTALSLGEVRKPENAELSHVVDVLSALNSNLSNGDAKLGDILTRVSQVVHWPNPPSGLLSELTALSYLSIAIRNDIVDVGHKLKRPDPSMPLNTLLDFTERLHNAIIQALRQYQIAVVHVEVPTDGTGI